MAKKKGLIIFGTGEIGELAKYYFENDSDYQVVAFTADDEFVKQNEFCERPLLPQSEIKEHFPPSECDVHVALSYKMLNRIRESKYILMKEKGYKLASYVCSKSVYWGDLAIGDNCFILENQTIQPTVTIGNNVMIWSGNHIGHGAIIGDHVYISSHVVISGHTTIGERSFFGVNSATRDFISIGSDVFVGMGVSVTKNLASGSVVLPPKSTTLLDGDETGNKIKKKYFGL